MRKKHAIRGSVPAMVWLASGCLGPSEIDPSASHPDPVDTEQAGPELGEQHNLLRNADFEEGSAAPWSSSLASVAAGTAKLEDGAYCFDLTGRGYTAWDAQLRHRALRLQHGHEYVVEFTAFADRATQVRPKVGTVGPPYAEYWASVVDVGTTPNRYVGRFLMRADDDKQAELSFQLAGPLAPEGGPVKVCFDDVALKDPQYRAPAAPPELSRPRVRVNQVGYFPRLGKRATLKTKSKTPVPWHLVDAHEEIVAEGMSTVFGEDRASGELVHAIDFSQHTTPGAGFRLHADSEISYPFEISSAIYRDLKHDALHFFYHQRSGIELSMPHTGNTRWSRPAGHTSDESVECEPELDCGFSMDIHGGWYDAGDHGKYVVNAGITVWTLLNLYERARHLSSDAAFGDGTLAIPERSNGIDDLLDEVRYELEFEMRMQVPSSAPKWQGMAFHKVHEEQWTAMPKAPHEAQNPRYLHRPSTAATLNLAANTAQCARIWKDIDPAFAKRCLAAATVAWEAAQRHPDLLAPGSDNVGGGPYDDLRLHDEFYWAAVELYLTTGNRRYAEYVRASSQHLDVSVGAQSAFNWQLVGALGVASIATVPGFDDETVDQAKAALVRVADAYAATVAREGYRPPLSSQGGNTYPWGSNSLLLNNMLVLGLAYDFTHDPRYRQAVADGMDYLLGRNPMSQSYVTGYGEVPLQNPHHRFWAHQLDATYPEPPPGIVSGGPNSALQDPYAQSAGLPGCAPQKCFVDHIESWSTNEVAINWNAPLVWVTAFLDDVAG